MDELAFKSAGELAALIRSRAISSVELLELYLRRIERFNRPVNAVVTLDVDRARERARGLDQQLARGVLHGPLHGVPMTIKDAYETEGMRSTAGAKALADHVPGRNAVAVQRLLDAGAVIFGKTNVPTYSADVQTYNDVFGTTNNPHDLSRAPGGSSGGAAVAVACGFTALELGSDIGGSIRHPANWTGVYGHKPSYGLVPTRGHVPPSPGALAESDISVGGPLARSALDLALALDIVAGPDEDARKAYKLALPEPRSETLEGYRIAGWLDDPAFPVDQEVLIVLGRAIAALEQAGAPVDTAARPELTLAEIYEGYSALLTPIIIAQMPEAVLARLASVADQPQTDSQNDAFVRFARNGMQRHIEWLRANERRARHRARWAAFFERFDVLLCPVSGVPAIPHDNAGSQLTRQITVNGVKRPYMDLLGWTSIASGCQLPATVVPVGRTRSGLPVGLQIVGPYLEDRTPLDFAARVTDVWGAFEPPPGY